MHRVERRWVVANENSIECSLLLFGLSIHESNFELVIERIMAVQSIVEKMVTMHRRLLFSVLELFVNRRSR